MDTPRTEPIPMPLREPAWRPLAEQLGEKLGECVRRARTESLRFTELLRAARTPAGRQRNLAPLMVLVASAGFLLGIGLGLRRR